MTKILELICGNTGLSSLVVDRIVSDAPKSYKVFFIPKRSGGKREIAQPSAELKIIQRSVRELLLDRLPVHECAMAYVNKKNIRSNAFMHRKSNVILKMDFKDFFPSITSDDWKTYCTKNCILDAEDIEFTSNLLFRKRNGERKLTLSIGAPKSPPLSNILMYEFDQEMYERTRLHNIVYTRYADDMTFSAQRTGYLNEVPKIMNSLKGIVEYPRLTVNTDKTVRATRRYGRYVTGLTLANDGSVGIGRKKQDVIRSKVHKSIHGILNPSQLESLAGTLAFVKSVDPEFLSKLRRKYGESTIQQIMSIKPERKYRPIDKAV